MLNRVQDCTGSKLPVKSTWSAVRLQASPSRSRTAKRPGRPQRTELGIVSPDTPPDISRTEELCRKLKPILGKKIDGLWRAYLAEADTRGKADIEQTLELLAAKHLGHDYQPDRRPFPPPPKPFATSGDVPLGAAAYGGAELFSFSLRSARLKEHVLVAGRSGSGKTNLTFILMQGIMDRGGKVLALDWKRGYGNFLNPFPAVRNTREAAELAERLLDRWLKEHPQPSSPQPRSDGSEAQDQQSDAGSTPPGGQSDHQTGTAESASGQEPDEANPRSDDSNTDTQRDTDQSQADSSSAGQGPAPDDAAGDERSQANDGDEAAPPATELTPDQASAEQQPASEQEPHGMDGADTPPDDSSSGQVASHGQGGTLIGEVLGEAIAECVVQADTSTEYRVFSKEHEVLLQISPKLPSIGVISTGTRVCSHVKPAFSVLPRGSFRNFGLVG